MPTSLPPWSYQGCVISSQVSCTTLLGAGRAAPGREPSTCQTSTRKPMTSSGGSTWVRKARAAVLAHVRSSPGGRGAASGRDSTEVLMVLRAPSGGAALDVLDREAVEVFLRVGRVEHL